MLSILKVPELQYTWITNLKYTVYILWMIWTDTTAHWKSMHCSPSSPPPPLFLFQEVKEAVALLDWPPYDARINGGDLQPRWIVSGYGAGRPRGQRGRSELRSVSDCWYHHWLGCEAACSEGKGWGGALCGAKKGSTDEWHIWHKAIL